ncbi:MAG: adenylyl-sulfate kinase [Pyrinomonadaceae bacterium]
MNFRDRRTIDLKGFTLWFTGLSGAGKSTLAERLVPELCARGVNVEVLDGDEVRTNLSKDLVFQKRTEIQTSAESATSAAFWRATASARYRQRFRPHHDVRDEVRNAIEGDGASFIEVYVKCPIDVLAERDVKGLYKKLSPVKSKTSQASQILTKSRLRLISSLRATANQLMRSARRILSLLEERGFIPIASAFAQLSTN